MSDRPGGRRRRRHRRPVVRLLPAPPRVRRHVVESNRIGSGASFANGGWLCPAQAGPLPEPGLTLYGMRTFLDRDSALYFQPRALPAARAVAAAVLDVLQRARPRARHGRDRAARPRRLRPGRGDAGRRRRVRAAQAGHGVRRPQRRRRARRAAQARSRCASTATSCPTTSSPAPSCTSSSRRCRPKVTAGFLIREHWHVRPDSLTAGPGRRAARATASRSARAPRWSSSCRSRPAVTHGAHRRRRRRRRHRRARGRRVDDRAGALARHLAPDGAGQGLQLLRPPER